MKAMLLAAGRGSRLRPLTDTTPKPLLPIAGKPLIVHTIERLAAAGVDDLVINLAYLVEQFHQTLGDGSQFGVRIRYSLEEEGGLETGGGIYNALDLDLLGDAPFLVVNSDFYTDYPLGQLPTEPKGLGHLVLVDTPEDQAQGDFVFEDGQFQEQGEPNVIFAGIGVYRPELFANCQPGKFSLTPLLRQGIRDGLISGEYYSGAWHEVGTPERYRALQEMVAAC